MKSKEVRGSKLVAAIKRALPNAGHVKLDPHSSGRRVFFEWRHADFVVSSRLKVELCGFGRLTKAGRTENDETDMISQKCHNVA